ncbi:MAG: hypothetical protein IKE43_03515 [Coriobacteriales bacterium]|nr:hypothetical protein [Coriobacteriales bacterium]
MMYLLRTGNNKTRLRLMVSQIWAIVFGCILLAGVLLAPSCVYAQEANTSQQPFSTSGTFTYLTYDSMFAEYTYTYDESWFYEDAYVYNHELAKMSLRMSLAASDTMYALAINLPFARAANVLDLMGQLGFETDLSSDLLVIHYPEPSLETIGFAISSKELDSDTSLILVATRGAGYGYEWGGNLEVGDGICHLNYERAANEIVANLADYMNQNAGTLKSTCKVWLSGFSRGAAVANLVAAKLDQGIIPGINSSSVYTYCFECPQNTRDQAAHDSMYGNIFSVVNPLDILPRFAFSVWGYTCYGVIYELPSLDSTPSYNELKSNMCAYYEDILSHRMVSCSESVDQLTGEASGEAETFDTFMDALGKYFGNPAKYTKKNQDELVAYVQKHTINDKGLDLGSVFTDIINGGTSSLWGFPFAYPIETISIVIYISQYGAFNMHYPELCLAWMESLSAETWPAIAS